MDQSPTVIQTYNAIFLQNTNAIAAGTQALENLQTLAAANPLTDEQQLEVDNMLRKYESLNILATQIGNGIEIERIERGSSSSSSSRLNSSSSSKPQ